MKVTETQARTYFDAINRLTPADRYTVTELWLETVHRIGPWLTLFDAIEDMIEDYDATLSVENCVIALSDTARYYREDTGETCTECPTHCAVNE